MQYAQFAGLVGGAVAVVGVQAALENVVQTKRRPPIQPGHILRIPHIANASSLVVLAMHDDMVKVQGPDGPMTVRRANIYPGYGQRNWIWMEPNL